LKFAQLGWNGGRAALGILVATALALLPSAFLATLRLPARTTILTRGEVGVLEHLRQEAPLRALRRLFATRDASQGESLLDRFEDEVRLWRVARDASSVRPGPRFAPLGLR